MAESITVASRFGRMLAAGTAVLSVLIVVVTAIDGGVADAVRLLPALALAVTLAWLIFWQPSVTVSDGGVEIRNVLRTIELPWPSIIDVDTRWALTLHTSYGRFVVWAAPAPGMVASRDLADDPALKGLPESSYRGGTARAADHPDTDSGQAALLVRQRWQAMQDAGYLSDGRLERGRPRMRIHWWSIAVTAVLIGASALATVL